MTIPLRIEDAGTLTFGSLFAGIGGFDLGFERAGMSCKWQVEIDDYANRVLEKHWPNVHRERDICECGAHNLGRVDVICGGFPCQDISSLGKRRGVKNGTRSGLWSEMHRIICCIRPRFVVVENVSEITFRGLDTVLGDLAASGYDAEWTCISPCQLGAPQQRDRLWVVAHANDRDVGMLSRVRRDIFGKGRAVGQIAAQDIAEGDWWATEPALGRVANGVPDWVASVKRCGNAVVPQIAEWIGRRLMEKLK